MTLYAINKLLVHSVCIACEPQNRRGWESAEWLVRIPLFRDPMVVIIDDDSTVTLALQQQQRRRRQQFDADDTDIITTGEVS